MIVLTTVLLALTVMIVGCQNDEHQELRILTDEDRANAAAASLARIFNFDIDANIDHALLDLTIWRGENIHYLEFVYDIEDIIDPPDDTIFFFPTEQTLGAIEKLNELIAENDIDLSAFSLSYPLSLGDLVYNTESVIYLGQMVLEGYLFADVRMRQTERHTEIYQARILESLNLSEEDVRLRQLLLFGQGLHFEHNMDLRFMDMRQEIESGTHRFTDVVFVHTPDEALGVADGVIALWPTEHSIRATDLLNERINRSERFDFEDFGLSYPITIEDVVDSWESVLEVWQNIGSSGRRGNFIRSMPRRELFERTSGD